MHKELTFARWQKWRYLLPVISVLFTWIALVILSVNYYKMLQVRDASTNIVSYALPAVVDSTQYEFLARENFRLLLEHIIASKPSEMTAIESKIEQATAVTDAAQLQLASVLKTPKEKALLDRCVEFRRGWRASRDRILPLSRDLRNDAAMQLYYSETKPAFDAFVTATEDLKQHEIDAGKENGAAIVQSVEFTLWFAVGGLFAALGTAVVVILLVRSIVFPMIALALSN